MIKKILQRLVNNPVWYSGLLISYTPKREVNTTKTLCIIRTDAIGDFVLFTPSLKYLREKYDGFKITLIIQYRLKGLAENCSYIDSIISFNEKKYRRNLFYKILTLLRIYLNRFTICINPVYSRERIIEEMVLWTNANKKIGWDTKSPNMTENEKKRGDKIYTHLIKSNLNKYEHELKRNKEFLENLGIKADRFIMQNYYGEKEKEHIEKIFKQFNLNGEQVFAIVPGSLVEYKQWGNDNWINLMNKIINITERPKFLIVGSQKDKELIKIKHNDFLFNYTLNLCDKFELNELAPLFEGCTLVIGNDTGPMHIAIASGAHTISILGGGHFGRFMPYGDVNKNKFVYKKMDCFQCDWQCIYPEKKCITEITVKEVFDEVKKLLNSKINYIDKDKISVK